MSINFVLLKYIIHLNMIKSLSQTNYVIVILKCITYKIFVSNWLSNKFNDIIL